MPKSIFFLTLGAFMSISAISSANQPSPVLQEQIQELQSRSPAPLFVTRDGEPTPALVRLLKASGLFAEGDRLAAIVEKTQKPWISVQQGRGQIERTDLRDSPERAALREAVDEFIHTSGFYDERKNLFQNYTYAVCHGAFLDGARKNIVEIVNLWKKGVRFSSLVFLTGDRPLRKGPADGGREPEDAVRKLEDATLYPLFKKGWKKAEDAAYENEYDMVRLVWDQTDIPEDMAKALKGRISFINAPKPEGMGRPGTKDTFREWLKSHPEPGTIIASGRALLWPYQQLVGETALRDKDFGIDTVASAVSEEELKLYGDRIVSIALDTFAKCLYEIQEARTTQL